MKEKAAELREKARLKGAEVAEKAKAKIKFSEQILAKYIVAKA